MKTHFRLLLLFIAIGLSSNAAVLVIEGKFQNKNIYVQNGYSSSGVGFCAYEVKVNGHVTTDEVNSSAFEIDLTAFKLKIGDKVVIEILHKDGCVPKVLNPDALKPKPTFEVISINLSNDGVLSWSTKNEYGSLPFVVEQYKWNKWVYVGEVAGNGTPELHEYKFKVNTHSGENKFRVKQIGFGFQPRYSTAVTNTIKVEKPTFEFSKDNKSLNFTSETAYEVYDYYGTVIKKGYGNSLDISNMNKGKYYLCYDNEVTEIIKKR